MSKRAAKAAVSTKVRFYEWRVLSCEKSSHTYVRAGRPCLHGTASGQMYEESAST